MIDFFGLSETGSVREENQDAVLLPGGYLLPDDVTFANTFPDKGTLDDIETASGDQLGQARDWQDGWSPDGLLTRRMFALADGMGGYAQGGLASRLVLRALFDTCCSHSNQAIPAILKRAINAANLAVINETARLGVGRMGSTLIAACLDGARLHLAHIGDSRAYLIRPGTDTATCLTQDHTVVGDLLRMRVIASHQVRTHARRSILTKAIGMAMFVQPDVFSVDLHPGDRLVLCTDGVWCAVEDDEFARLAKSTDNAQALCHALIDLALDHGSDDNVSVIAAHFRDLPRSLHTDTAAKNGAANWFQRALKRKN